MVHTTSPEEFNNVMSDPDNIISLVEHVSEDVDRIQLRERDPEAPKTNNVCVAAMVTSYGRCILYDYLDKVPADDRIYTDTDSCLYICRDGKEAFPFSSMLGGMSREEADQQIVGWR